MRSVADMRCPLFLHSIKVQRAGGSVAPGVKPVGVGDVNPVPDGADRSTLHLPKAIISPPPPPGLSTSTTWQTRRPRSSRPLSIISWPRRRIHACSMCWLNPPGKKMWRTGSLSLAACCRDGGCVFGERQPSLRGYFHSKFDF